MSMIYDLDNEYGGRIVSDTDVATSFDIKHQGTGPAFTVNSFTAGQPALAVYSTVSASPVDIKEITVGGGGALFRSAVTNANSVTIGKTVKGNMTYAPLVFSNLSQASVPVMDFGNNFISVASVGAVPDFTLGQAQKWIVVRAGAVNYGMPLFGLSSLVNGPGAYA